MASSPLAAQMSPLRYPPVRGGQIRIEGYLVPAVTSWPAYPSWSPDGREIAFSMDGRIWIVSADGGSARQLTAGPGYDFEPDFSPDGRAIAFSRDVGGNLDIYVIGVEGGEARRLTDDPALEFHPRFRASGRIVYASAVSGNFDLYSVEPSTGSREPLYPWPTNEIQPDPSPVSDEIAFVSSRSNRIGAGGIWVGERELHFEETTFRTRPAFSPDGKWMAYVSDAAGSRDIWLLPAEGGLPFQLTRDAEADEFAPAWSPEGDRIVYMTNRGGQGSLEIVSLYGGSLRPVAIRDRRYREFMGRLEVSLSHPARVTIVGSDGRAHAPEGVFRRVVSFTETHYFHASGSFALDVPAGETKIRAMHGPEYRPLVRSVTVPAGEEARVELNLERWIDMPARGWYSGDTHVHDLHAGDVRLAPRDLVGQAEAEDVHVVNALIHIDGTKLMGDLSRFHEEAHPASTKDVLLRYGQEYRMPFGHRTILNNQKMFFPLVSALDETAYRAPFPPLFDYLRRLKREQPHVLAGAPHPYFGYLARGELPTGGAPSEIPADVALGLVDFFDVNCVWSDERGSASIYAKLLNAGFRLPAAGGSDTFSDLWRDPPLGTGRTYVRVEGALSLASWFEGLRAGRSFATNGPLLELDVEGKGMGEELSLSQGREVSVTARARSPIPMEAMHVLVNGRPAASVRREGRELEWSGTVPAQESVWIAVQAGGGPSPWITDSYLFAHSTPVYVSVDGAPVQVEEDRAYLERYLDALIDYARSEAAWETDAQRDIAVTGFEEARDEVRKLRRSR